MQKCKIGPNMVWHTNIVEVFRNAENAGSQLKESGAFQGGNMVLESGVLYK